MATTTRLAVFPKLSYQLNRDNLQQIQTYLVSLYAQPFANVEEFHSASRVVWDWVNHTLDPSDTKRLLTLSEQEFLKELPPEAPPVQFAKERLLAFIAALWIQASQEKTEDLASIQEVVSAYENSQTTNQETEITPAQKRLERLARRVHLLPPLTLTPHITSPQALVEHITNSYQELGIPIPTTITHTMEAMSSASSTNEAAQIAYNNLPGQLGKSDIADQILRFPLHQPDPISFIRQAIQIATPPSTPIEISPATAQQIADSFQSAANPQGAKSSATQIISQSNPHLSPQTIEKLAVAAVIGFQATQTTDLKTTLNTAANALDTQLTPSQTNNLMQALASGQDITPYISSSQMASLLSLAAQVSLTLSTNESPSAIRLAVTNILVTAGFNPQDHPELISRLEMIAKINTPNRPDIPSFLRQEGVNIPPETVSNLTQYLSAPANVQHIATEYLASNYPNIIPPGFYGSPVYSQLQSSFTKIAQDSKLSSDQYQALLITAPVLSAQLASSPIDSLPQIYQQLYKTSNGVLTPEILSKNLSPFISQLSSLSPQVANLHAHTMHYLTSNTQLSPENASPIAWEITTYRLAHPQASSSEVSRYLDSFVPRINASTNFSTSFATYMKDYHPSATGDALIQQSLYVQFLRTGMTSSSAKIVAAEALPLVKFQYFLAYNSSSLSYSGKPDPLRPTSAEGFSQLSPSIMQYLSTHQRLSSHFSRTNFNHFDQRPIIAALASTYSDFNTLSRQFNFSQPASGHILGYLNFVSSQSSTINQYTAAIYNRFANSPFAEKYINPTLKNMLILKSSSYVAVGNVGRVASRARLRVLAGSRFAAEQATERAIARFAASSAGKTVAKVAASLGLKGALHVAANTIAPLIGELVMVAVDVVLALAMKAIKAIGGLLKKVLKEYIIPVTAALIGALFATLASLGAIATGAVSLGAGLAAQAVSTGFSGGLLPRFLGGIGNVFGALITTTITVLVTPVVVIVLSIPIVVAFFVYIITQSAYLVPPELMGLGGAYPHCWPAEGNITQGPPHGQTLRLDAFDIGLAMGTPVYATHDGISTSYVDTHSPAQGSYGNYIKVVSPAGFCTLYGHLASFGVTGEVKAGTIIGYSDNTGTSTGPHLHYEFQKPCQTYAGVVPGSTEITKIVPPGWSVGPSNNYAGSCFAKDSGGSNTPI